MLSKSCESLAGVGPILANKLSRCGINTLADLLFHLPFRYQDRTRVTPIQDLRVADHAVIAGEITKTEIKYGKRPSLFCYIKDKTGIARLRFFHFNKQQAASLKTGQYLRAFGEVHQFANQLEMIHPEYQLLNDENTLSVEETFTPIYPSTEGLSQNRLRLLVKAALLSCQSALTALEWMTGKELGEHSLLSIAEALTLLHNPPPDTILSHFETGEHPALKRMVFDELLAQRLSMQFAKAHRHRLTAPSLPPCPEFLAHFLAHLPFSLTSAQRRVNDEIALDLTSDKPMLRLVQGDVGCGKTTVAAIAALQAIAAGFQVALMAPTELLSEQHAQTLQTSLKPLGIHVGRLSGKMRTKERRDVLQKLANHECQLLIGTHALFQEDVQFKQLGLIIIDEQHRFGVDQRLQLQKKGEHATYQLPHQLLMTATPIPRTLAMTQFAHLDISVIDELPPERKPVQTAVINQAKRETIVARLESAISEGRQAYWICTLIEESEKSQCQAALLTTDTLKQQLPKARIGLVHGRMKAQEKELIMQAFKCHELDLLVATTVIEVGVDVPNASLMIIENAERLGLSQLHQLRGRVGRGHQQAYCLLLYQSPLTDTARERLHIMRSTNDGFIIAEKDLQLRGAGEVLGNRQTGYQTFKIANLQRDKSLLPNVTKVASDLLAKRPELAQHIASRWFGDFERYIQA